MSNNKSKIRVFLVLFILIIIPAGALLLLNWGYNFQKGHYDEMQHAVEFPMSIFQHDQIDSFVVNSLFLYVNMEKSTVDKIDIFKKISIQFEEDSLKFIFDCPLNCSIIDEKFGNGKFKLVQTDEKFNSFLNEFRWNGSTEIFNLGKEKNNLVLLVDKFGMIRNYYNLDTELNKLIEQTALLIAHTEAKELNEAGGHQFK